MTRSTLPQPSGSAAPARTSHGWWVLVLTTLICGTLLLFIGGLWSLSIGEAVHYSQSDGSDADLRFGEAISGVVFGAVLILPLLVGSTLIAWQVSKAFGIAPSAGVFVVATPLCAEVAYFVARPFVLEAQGIYQG